jgi:hypothetical protein
MLTKKVYNKVLFPITVALLIILIAIARVLWGYGYYGIPPLEPYSDWWETISGLGDWEQSPIGFIYFQFWGLVFGIFIIHILPYIHQRLAVYGDYPFSYGVPLFDKIMKNFIDKVKWKAINNVRRGSFFLMLGGIGFILMGFFPADALPVEKLHEISAGVGFGGIFFANWFYTRVLYLASNDGRISRKLQVISQIMWWFLIIGTAVTYLIAELYYKEMYDLGWYDTDWGDAGVPVIFSFPVWERIGFIIGCAYLGLLGYLLPAEVVKIAENNKRAVVDVIEEKKVE